ncbi:MAG: alpha/beta hydrolase [Planctomycetota bacterium]
MTNPNHPHINLYRTTKHVANPFVYLALMAALSSVSAFADQNAGDYEVRRVLNVSYCEHPDEAKTTAGNCDLFLPVDAAKKEDAGIDNIDPAQPSANGKRPVIVVVHGGAWVAGDKWTMDQHASKLAEAGYAAVAINYRHAPKHKFPSQVDDLRVALVWIHDHAEQYDFDLERVGLYGYSAGGHLVSLIGTLADESWEKVQPTTNWSQDDPRWEKMPDIRAVCAGGPPTDFQTLPPDNTSLAFFLGGSRRECPENYRAASPVCFVSASDPPIQIVHGESDGIVPIAGSRAFLKKLSDAGTKASLFVVPKKGHMLTFISPQLTGTMLEFFHQHLRR